MEGPFEILPCHCFEIILFIYLFIYLFTYLFISGHQKVEATNWESESMRSCPKYAVQFFSNSFLRSKLFVLYSEKIGIFCTIDIEISADLCRLFYEGNSISKLQIVIEKNRMEIMTYKQYLFFNIIFIQI